MKSAIALIGLTLCFVMSAASGEEAKTYTEGQVTELSFIKIKPGKFDDYMKYLDTTYKSVMEANKKAGLITGYSVYSAQARSPQEPDIILSVVYANMAALDKSDEAEAVATKVMGSTAVQSKAAQDRESMREVLGSELIRELVLK
jgi:L-rhamnose mutarotase